ncbi:hypothetical protein NK6_7799 [Bradyrhizobium diazoefficiens]|uniref:Uncharacterized protein n=1 Tax=Bradyrhizobium diazoefficiens TaxID=1355477 RepID=A0A0E3VWI1_9BRAD|nr:hypothetical protein NK6_7799 [Bradyrhizobium diazoefficiens]
MMSEPRILTIGEVSLGLMQKKKVGICLRRDQKHHCSNGAGK